MKRWLAAGCIGWVVSTGWAMQAGDTVPDLPILSTTGKDVRLSDYRGSWLVLYFYPKAFTSGCTAQACTLRDHYGDIQAMGAVILGVSADGLEKQQAFKQEHNLPFDLLCDEDLELAKAFDALAIGGFLARRVTFIVDPDGRVARVIDQVKAGSHDEEVISALREARGDS